MNEEERRRLYELGFGNIPITTTRYTAPYTASYTAPFYGLTASDENLQDVAPFSTALTEPAMEPAQVNAGMAEVELPYFSRFPLAQQAMDQGTFDALEHADSILGGVSQESKKDTFGRTKWKELVEKLPTTGRLGDVSNWAISTVMQQGLPFSGFTGDDIATATTAESIKDAVNNEIIMNVRKAGIPKDDLISSIVTGVNPLIQTSDAALTAAADYVSKGGQLDQNDLIEMAYQQDTFKDIPAVPVAAPVTPVAAPSGPSPAERARQAALNAQMAQEAAARQRQQQAAVAAEQARQAQVVAAQEDAARQAALAKQVYAQLMSGRDRGEPSAREVQAAMERATQVDTFSEAGGDRGMGNFGGEQGMWT